MGDDEIQKARKIIPAKRVDLSWIGFPSKDSESICGIGFMDCDAILTDTGNKNHKMEREFQRYLRTNYDEEKFE